MVSCFRLCKHPRPKAKQSMYGIFAYIYHKHTPNVGKYTIHGCYGKWYRRCPISCNKLVFHYPKVRCWQCLGRRIRHYPSGWVVAHGLSSALQFCNDHWAGAAIQAVGKISAISVISLRVKYHDHPWSQCCLAVQNDANCKPRLQEQRCTRKKPNPLVTCQFRGRSLVDGVNLGLHLRVATRWNSKAGQFSDK